MAVDETSPRPELDIENPDLLRNYLMSQGYLRSDEVVSVRKLEGGVSNRTVRVTWADGRAWVVKQALVKLRVSEDWFGDPARVHVEALTLRWLNRVAPAGTTPTFVFEDTTQHVLAMEAIPEDHENWRSLLLRGEIVCEHFEQFGRLLSAIHCCSSANLAELSSQFFDTSHFESLRLQPYYIYTAQKRPLATTFLHALVQDTVRHKLSLVHGDFSPKNVLIYKDKLVLLDYEVVHIGDPAFDVGFALTHFLSKAHHVSEKRALLGDAALLFWRSYFREVQKMDWDQLEPRVVRHALGCLLARVAGKSTLDYLTPPEASWQGEIVERLMLKPPTEVSEFIREFIQKVESNGKN